MRYTVYSAETGEVLRTENECMPNPREVWYDSDPTMYYKWFGYRKFGTYTEGYMFINREFAMQFARS